MSNPIAVYSGNTVLYWSAIIITLGLLASLLMTLGLQRSDRNPGFLVFLVLPLTVAFSVPLCRLLHWYCHAEQYGSFSGAMRDYSSGSYVLAGALLGAWFAAWLATRLDRQSCASLLDAFAPGAALAVAFIRLSALFNSSCRSKISVTTPALQHLPVGSPILNSAGGLDYRFATFFIHFLIMLLICHWLLRFFAARRHTPMLSGAEEGNVARMFLVLYSASELVLDSTRYDSSFLPINGFVSFVQIVAAVSICAILVYYTVHSVRANGMRYYHWLIWVGWVACGVGVGITEYLVQRHGDWYLSCYGSMGLCCLLMAVLVYRMYKTCCDEIED